jgi:hypothetical protein
MNTAARSTGPGLPLRERVAHSPIAWAGWVFFARYLADSLRDAWRGNGASIGHLANLGIFQLLAWTAIIYLTGRGHESRRASNVDVTFIGLISLCALLPDDNASWLGLSALAAYALFVFPQDRHLRAAAAVMLALATQLFWGRILFELVAFNIEVFDAKCAAGLLSFLHYSVSLQGNLIGTQSHQIVIYEACTSFHNISLAMLGWVAITKLARLEWRLTDLITAAALVVVTVVMNSLRLFLMASSAPGKLDYWHVGFGSQVINAGLSALITTICLLGARKGHAK